MVTRKQIITQIKKMGCTIDKENNDPDILVIDAPRGKRFGCTGTHCLVEPLTDPFNPLLTRGDAYREIAVELSYGLFDCDDPDCDICCD